MKKLSIFILQIIMYNTLLLGSNHHQGPIKLPKKPGSKITDFYTKYYDPQRQIIFQKNDNLIIQHPTILYTHVISIPNNTECSDPNRMDTGYPDPIINSDQVPYKLWGKLVW